MDQSNKKRETQEEIEQKCQDILNKIVFGKDDLVNLVISMNKEVRKSINENLKRDFLKKFHQALSKFKVDTIKEDVYTKLKGPDLMMFFDYMNYSFECLSKNVKVCNDSSYSTAYLLKAFNSFIEFKGTQGIIEGISAKKSLVNSVITIC